MSEQHWFVKAWEEAWREPATRFAQLFHPDGTLFQSGMEHPIRRDEIPTHVARRLAVVPDLRISANRWAINGDDVFIEWSASGTFQREAEPRHWSGASRFTLRDGLIIEEKAYFDAHARPD